MNKEVWVEKRKGQIVFSLVALFILITINFVSAGIQINNNPSNGIEISYPQFEYIKTGNLFNLTIWNYNLSNGLRLSGSNCSFYVLNNTGNISYDSGNMTFVQNGYNKLISAGNFTLNGLYAYDIYCENNGYGGFASGTLKVTNTGTVLTTDKSIMYIILFSILFFIFLFNLFVVSKLPDKNVADEEGKLISISWLKYLRSTILFIDYILFIVILFLSSTLAYSYLGETVFANVLFALYRIAFRLAPVVLIIWIVWIFAKIFQDKKFWGMMKRGMFPQGNL